ncbi:unnamed protein product [Mucor hiemalis]
MSNNRNRSRPRWQDVDWDSPDLSGPVEVNATLNFDTNEFEVTQPPTRSKFDFGSNTNSKTWAFEADRGWGASPDHQGKSWNHTAEKENEPTGKFSSRETTTFRLNLEIDDDTPIFSKVTDYELFRD